MADGAEAPRVLVVSGPGRVDWVPEDPPGPLPEGRVDLVTRFSGLSAGTDLSFVKGTNPMTSSSWDPELGLFDAERPGQGYPVRRFGYMQVGEVVASAHGDWTPGDLVATTYGHR